MYTRVPVLKIQLVILLAVLGSTNEALAQATSFKPPDQQFLLSFGGNHLALASAANVLQLGSAFTMEAWVYLTAASPYGVIMGRSNDIRSADPYHQYVLGFEGTDGLRPSFVQSTGTPGTYTLIQTQQNIPLRTWTHLAAALDNGIMRLFVNGLQVASRASPGPPSTTGIVRFAIGAEAKADNSASNGIQGALRQVRVWSRALPANELRTYATQKLSGNEAGLLADWPLSEGSGQVVRGATSQTPTLTIQGASWVNTLLFEKGPYWEIQDLPSLTTTNYGVQPAIFLNAKRLPDILLAYTPYALDKPTAGPILFLHNEGNRVFTPVKADQPSMAVWPRNDTVADFDGDGYEDVVMADHGYDAPPFPGGITRIFMQRSAGMKDETDARLPPGPAFTHDVCSADVNKDGSPDLFFASLHSGGTIQGPILHLNDGKGHFKPANELLPAAFRAEQPPNFLSCRFADVSRDGAPDLLLGAWSATAGSQNRDWLLLNDGNGNLHDVTAQSMPPRLVPREWPTLGLEPIDVNRDGWSDLIVNTQDNANNGNTTTMQLLINNGDGTFRNHNDAALNVVWRDGWFDKTYAIDLNQDGWPDLVANKKGPGGGPHLYQNMGGYFEDRTQTLTARFSTGRPADFDGDGRIDIALIRGNTNKIAWGKNVWPAATATPPSLPPGLQTMNRTLLSGGVTATQTISSAQRLETGYARVDVNSGPAPYGTAVFSVKNGNVVIGEVGVPSSPPTVAASVFIEYSAGTAKVSTGLAVVNPGTATANVTYVLRGLDAGIIAVGHGAVAGGAHFARFIDQLADVAPDFVWMPDFATRIRFATLEITSSQPLSMLALRQTLNQRNEALFATTPVSDLAALPSSTRRFIAIFADGVFSPGNSYSTTLALLNTSSASQTGSVAFFDPQGRPMAVRPVGMPAGSSFRYQIPSHGGYVLETTGGVLQLQIGSVQLIPDAGSSPPAGAAIVRISYGNVIASEFGAPAVSPTTHALIYVDKSGPHDTGIALASTDGAAVTITARAFQENGTTPAGTGEILLTGLGQKTAFAGEVITGGLPAGFTGVLDISSSTPFAALTLRTLYNERGEFLMTTFPVADLNQPAPTPIIFPHIVDGLGYRTETILLSSGAAAEISIRFMDKTGAPLFIGQ